MAYTPYNSKEDWSLQDKVMPADMIRVEAGVKDLEEETLAHESRADNPHAVTKTQLGLENVNNTADVNKPISSATAAALALKAAAADLSSHTARVDNPHAVTKEQVGLGNVDNTSDLNKPVSTAVVSQLNLKANKNTADAHYANTSNPHSVTKSQVGLGNCDNTTDLNKPLSTAATSALAGKAATAHAAIKTIPKITSQSLSSGGAGQEIVLFGGAPENNSLGAAISYYYGDFTVPPGYSIAKVSFFFAFATDNNGFRHALIQRIRGSVTTIFFEDMKPAVQGYETRMGGSASFPVQQGDKINILAIQTSGTVIFIQSSSAHPGYCTVELHP